MIKKLELDFNTHKELISYCKKNYFFIFSFDLESVELLNDLNLNFKIPSGEITNYPYLKKIGELNKKLSHLLECPKFLKFKKH